MKCSDHELPRAGAPSPTGTASTVQVFGPFF